MRTFPRQRYLIALLYQGPTVVAGLHSHTGSKRVGHLLGPACFQLKKNPGSPAVHYSASYNRKDARINARPRHRHQVEVQAAVAEVLLSLSAEIIILEDSHLCTSLGRLML